MATTKKKKKKKTTKRSSWEVVKRWLKGQDNWLRPEALQLEDPGKVFSALRGPDSMFAGSEKLKYHVTGRIRSIVFDHFPGIFTDLPLQASELEDVRLALKDIPMEERPRSYHFVSHLSTAVCQTASHPIWGGLGEKLVEVLQTHTGER